MIELRTAESRCVVTGAACLLGGNMIRGQGSSRALASGRVATRTLSRRTLEYPADMAGFAADVIVRARQRKTRRDMVETGLARLRGKGIGQETRQQTGQQNGNDGCEQ